MNAGQARPARFARHVRRAVAALAALVLLALIAWVLVLPTPRFAKPGGPYAIGSRIYYWTDPSRPEPFTADRGDHRRVVAQIWYPASGPGKVQRYIDRREVLDAIAGRYRLPPWLLGRLKDAPTHAGQDARPDGRRHPVLINPTGLSGFRAASLFWIEELVSYGYVVVTLDQPGTAAATILPDGATVPLVADFAAFNRYMPLALSRQGDRGLAMNGVALPGGIIPFLAQDLSFVLDRLGRLDREDPVVANALDLTHVGAFGMSLGGYIVPEACLRDARFQACVAVDAGKSAAVARDGLQQPLMIISRDAQVMREERSRAGGWPEAEIAHTIASQRALFERNRGDAYYATMNGMYHLNWTDAPLWSPLVRLAGLAGPIDPRVGYEMTNACTRLFFDQYLRSDRSARVCGKFVGQPSLRLEFHARS